MSSRRVTRTFPGAINWAEFTLLPPRMSYLVMSAISITTNNYSVIQLPTAVGNNS